MRYCLEAFRLNGTFGSFREAEADMSLEDESGQISIKKGEKIFVGAVRPLLCYPAHPVSPSRQLTDSLPL